MGSRLAFALLVVLPTGLLCAQETAVLNGLSLRRYAVEISADEEVARVVVEETFDNGADRGIAEADFFFPLPAAAAADDLQLEMGGRYFRGDLLDRGRANEIYEEITRRRRDPALLDCVGKQLFRCRVFPIPAHGQASVKLGYKQALASDGAMRRLVVPLDATRFNRRPADDFTLRVRLSTKTPLQAILSPTHEVDVERVGLRQAVVTVAARRAQLMRDFVLLYAVDDAPLGAVVASYRRAGEPGYFVLSLDAAFAREKQRQAPRDVVIAVDASSSTGREGLDAAAVALGKAVAGMRPADRFALMTFGTEPRLVAPFAAVGTSPQEQVMDALRRAPAAGRTRLAAAIAGATKVAASGRPGAGIVLLTDGNETEPGADPIDAAAAAVDAGHRVGLCGFGAEVDLARIEALGARGEGDSAWAVRGRGLDQSIRELFESTRSVPLTDVGIEVGGTFERYPEHLAVLRPNGSIVVAGRYRNGGAMSVVLRATVAGERVTHRIEANLRRTGGDPAVARIWAARKIGALLDAAREKGDPELGKAQIEALGRRYGIATPHSSLLVLEEADRRAYLRNLARRPLLSSNGGTVVARRDRTRERGSEGELAERIRRLRRCESAGVDPFEDLLGENRLRQRRVGDKTFYRQETGTWVESPLIDAEPASPRVVVFLSEEWLALLRADEEVARVLALGRDVLFTLADGTAVRVVRS